MNVYPGLYVNPGRCRKKVAFPLTPALSLGKREKFCRVIISSPGYNFIQLL
jgi:hypothetical protein